MLENAGIIDSTKWLKMSGTLEKNIGKPWIKIIGKYRKYVRIYQIKRFWGLWRSSGTKWWIM